jgi:hypothetical protein
MKNDLDDSMLRGEISRALGLPFGTTNHSIAARVEALIVRDLQQAERIREMERDAILRGGGVG